LFFGVTVTYEQIVEFITSKMKMSHIYQPLLIRSLVDAGGSATLRQLAQFFLSQDESQLLYYENRIKEMPLKVLSKHGVVSKEGELVHLNVKSLTLEQKAHIRSICEQKLQQFVQKRGLGIWDYRLLETDPIPDSDRFKVLKESGGRCALCGITKDDSPIDVDHIIPRSRGGSNDITNLQALCSKCNRSKRDKDSTDFRKPLPAEKDKECLFCSDDIKSRIVTENGPILAIFDKYPVTTGHTLIIPKRHTVDYFLMTTQERQCADEMIQFLRKYMAYNDPSIKGFNVGMNCGEYAGQTVMHAHIHLIPRRKGDVDNPRGGVRHVITGKGHY
jgi:diadenosine tetraphosphate (Ap4A) HIT family hydrolase